jgi:hypothetical protein
MNTLIIHPDDRSTDFLKPIYGNITNPTLITGGVTREEIHELIRSHDRIMMMGHGSPWGLFSVSKFKVLDSYIISNEEVHLLLQKKNNVFIWCNADKFVNRHELKGLYSGMFISEVGEALYCGLPGTLQETVNESNDSFADMLGKVIDEPLYKAYRDIKQQYKILAESNPVAKYNYERLYLN